MGLRKRASVPEAQASERGVGRQRGGVGGELDAAGLAGGREEVAYSRGPEASESKSGRARE